VLEMPDGRTVLYDAGAITGPDVTRRQVAPFLWGRGIRRIDEVILSHADLDHFNGLVALLERFSVGQVTCTPSFKTRPTPAIELTLEKLRESAVPVRVVKTGDVLQRGDVALQVLHPPAIGPDGNENARSMVLLINHGEHTLLLTGDLEGPGLSRLLALQAPRIDVLMAPHHGSPASNTTDLARWAKPAVVVSSQGKPRNPDRARRAYDELHVPYLSTWTEGAVTFTSNAQGLTAATYLTRLEWRLR
jgi:competence protein ComEC